MVAEEEPKKAFLEKDVNISRRNFIIGAAAGAGAIAIAGLVGRGVVEGEVRDQFLDPGDITPEIERALLNGDYIIHHTDPDVTAQTLNNAGMDFSTVPELLGTPILTTASEQKWFGFKRSHLRLPGEEEDTVGDLGTSVTNSFRGLSNEVEDELGEDLEISVIQPRLIHLLSLEHELRSRGDTIFDQPGYILTSSTFEVVEGVDEEGEEIVIEKAVGIGKETADGQLSLAVFDIDSEEPAPSNLSAGGIVVAE